MRLETQRLERFGRDRRQRVEAEGVGFGGVIGLDPGVLEPRHVGEEGNRAGGRKAGDEGGEAVAVMHQRRRARLFRRDKGAGHGAEEIVADQAPDDRIARLERRRSSATATLLR